MKFLIVFSLLVASSLAELAPFKNGDSAKRTQCSYFADTLSLTCRGPAGVVVCEALTVFPMEFKIVGLGLDPIWTGANRFRLYPLRQDNTAWINHQFLTESQRKISLSIHAASPVEIEDGISLKDAACFNRLVELFRSSESNLQVPLNKITSANTGEVRTATLFGTIILFNKSFPSTGAVVSTRVERNRF